MSTQEKIYLDYNATRPLRYSARQELVQGFELCGNPSAVHSSGNAIRRLIENSRETIAHALKIESRRIIFTSGATESNNIVLKNFKGRVIISAIEHSSVYKVRDDAVTCRVTNSGIIDLEHLEQLLLETDEPTLVSIIAAHNETGVIQPMEKIRELTQKFSVFLHTDATQALGRTHFNWNSFDFISFSGHKIGATTGIGILVINPETPVPPLMNGGGQERSYRPGTANLLGILSLKAVIQEALDEDWSQAKKLRDYLELQILAISPLSIIFGRSEKRIPNTSLLTMPNVNSATQVMSFDLNNICVSAGSACSSGTVKTSHTLKGMGYSDTVANSGLRVSLSPDTTKQDIDRFISVWKKIYLSCSDNMIINSDINSVEINEYNNTSIPHNSNKSTGRMLSILKSYCTNIAKEQPSFKKRPHHKRTHRISSTVNATS
ncbi:MAG TPA: cysteine desulfurase [Holosporales bacterium]|nr:cysteine desulfurase [Holosporales bacterium]